MNTDDLKRLTQRRDRIADDLQILEMQMGHRYMLASWRYKQYLALKARCEKAIEDVHETQG